jgi:hypothetical protein
MNNPEKMVKRGEKKWLGRNQKAKIVERKKRL